MCLAAKLFVLTLSGALHADKSSLQRQKPVNVFRLDSVYETNLNITLSVI